MRRKIKAAVRSSAHDDQFNARIDRSIPLAIQGHSPRNKSMEYPYRNRKWDGALHGFVPSRLRVIREVSRKIPQEVMRPKILVHLGFSRIAVAFNAFRSSYLLQVTQWDVG